jgi:2-hydroxy-4-carboxymuconate semialdehyde hemiacetal dehydrogenase
MISRLDVRSPGPINCAIVGTGPAADEHAWAMAAADASVSIVIGRTVDAARVFAQRHGIARSSHRLEHALDDAVDAVIVASPSPIHGEQVRTFLRAGKHVLCESPVALSLTTAMELTNAASRADRTLMVCHTQRYWPGLLELHQRITRGALTVRHVAGRLMLDRPDSIGAGERRRSWADDILWHHGAHAVDIVMSLIGSVDMSTIRAVSGVRTRSDLELDLAILMRAERGAVGTLNLSYRSRAVTNDYLVLADQGTYRLDRGRLADAASQSVGLDVSSVDPRRLAVQAQTTAFLAAVATGHDPVTSIGSMLPVFRVLDQIDRRRQRDR